MNPLGLPDVSVTIDCEGAQHRVTWSDGALRSEDHDVDAERAVVALGGAPPACVELVDAWYGATSPPLLLTLLRETRAGDIRDLTRAFTSLRKDMSQLLAGLVATAAAAPGVAVPRVTPEQLRGSARRRMHQRLLLSVPEDLKPPLVATLVSKVEELPALTFDEHMFDVAVREIVVAAVRESVGSWVRGARVPHLDVTLTRARSACELTSGAPSIIEVSVPLSWLAHVWARGLTIVDGCFILEATDATQDGARVRAVRWERDGRVVAPVLGSGIVVRSRDGWRLGWD